MRVLRLVVEKELNIRSGALHDYGAGMCGKAASLASMILASMNGGLDHAHGHREGAVLLPEQPD